MNFFCLPFNFVVVFIYLIVFKLIFQTMSAADPFYGPIVARIDSILNQYGAYIGEHCREWLVCNMYKNPSAFSPHSNFLSAELSRLLPTIDFYFIFVFLEHF